MPIFLQNAACDHYGREIMKNRYNREFMEILSWLNETQWWSYRELRDYQDRHLRSLIDHAYRNVPYYRRVMTQRGLEPGDIQGAGDLNKLPILTKDAVRQAGGEMVSAPNASKGAVHMHTSGTTGSGLKFLVSQKAYRMQWATWWRHKGRFNVHLGNPHVMFGGKSVVPLKQKEPPFWRTCNPLNRIYLSLYHMNPQNLPAYVDVLQSRRFKYYTGYPSAIYLLADYLRSISHKLINPPEIIITGAESLLPMQIKAFKYWIGCPVTEQYGQAEGCANISQCKKGNFHVDMEFAIIEPLEVKRTEHGRVCKIVGTSLHNYAQPFIRYDTGDLATFSDEPCTCGRKSPVVKYIDGRIESYVITPEGNRVGRLDHCFKDMVNIRESQIIQEDIAKITVRIVPTKDYSGRDEEMLLKEMRGRLGERMKIEFEYLDRIPRSSSGKFRAVISKIEHVHISGTDKIEQAINQGVNR